MGSVSAWQTLKRAGFSWRLRPGAPRELVARVFDPWTEDAAGVEVVKQNPSRAVFKLRLGGEIVYVKWHRFRGVWDAVLSLLHGTRGEREWKRALALERCGIPTAEPLLVGLRRWFIFPTESFFATREVKGVSLKALILTPAASRERADAMRRHRLARGLGDLVRRLHAGGLSHPDLHTDNFLVTADDDELCLLDLHAASVSGRISLSRRVQNLAVLNNSSEFEGATRTDRLRFGRAYLGEAWTRSKAWDLEKAVRAKSAQLRERRIRSRSRRCVVESSVFTNERTALGRVYRKRAMSLGQVSRAIELHRRVMAGEGEGEVLKCSPKTNVTLIPWDGSLEADRLCVKEFVRTGLLMRLLPGRLRHRPAMRSWRASLGLAVRGIGAPEAFALVMGKGALSYVVMAALTSAEPLNEYLGLMGPDLPVGRRRAFVGAAADFLLKCYAAGVRHRDLKAQNVFVRERGGRKWEFFLLDLAAVRFPRRLPREAVLLNLAQLSASTPLSFTWTDRMRFLRRLAETDPSLFERSTMQEVARRTLERTVRWCP